MRCTQNSQCRPRCASRYVLSPSSTTTGVITGCTHSQGNSPSTTTPLPPNSSRHSYPLHHCTPSAEPIFHCRCHSTAPTSTHSCDSCDSPTSTHSCDTCGSCDSCDSPTSTHSCDSPTSTHSYPYPSLLFSFFSIALATPTPTPFKLQSKHTTDLVTTAPHATPGNTLRFVDTDERQLGDDVLRYHHALECAIKGCVHAATCQQMHLRYV